LGRPGGFAKLAHEITEAHGAHKAAFKALIEHERAKCTASNDNDDDNERAMADILRIKHEEEAAVDAAERGDPKPLSMLGARLLGAEQRGHPESLEWLEPSTRALLGEILSGKRKRKPGALKKTRKERFVRTHAAAANARVLQSYLSPYYPQMRRRGKGVHPRVIDIAAKRAVIEVGTLIKYLNRSKNEPHRLK
jgi:hypothetical protein